MMCCAPNRALASSTAARRVQAPLPVSQMPLPGSASPASLVLLTMKSRVQSGSQPSWVVWLPSSHCSPASMMPLPHHGVAVAAAVGVLVGVWVGVHGGVLGGVPATVSVGVGVLGGVPATISVGVGVLVGVPAAV